MSIVKSTDFECVSASSDYIDIDCYVTCVDGSEWLFRTFLDRGDGHVTDPDDQPRFAEGPEDCFEDPDPLRPCPAEVMEAYKLQYPAICAELLRRASE